MCAASNSRFLATFLVIWVCPVILAQPSLYVRLQPQSLVKNAYMEAQDTVVKHFEAAPDTHSNETEHYSKVTHVKENLITPSGGKINTDTDVHRTYSKKEEEHVTHKDGAVDKTHDKDTGRYVHVVMHKQLDDKTKKAVLDVDNSHGDFATESKHVIKTSSGAVVTNKGERAVTSVKLKHLDSHVKDEKKTSDIEKQEGHASHTDQKKTSTVYVHNSDPNNLIIAGDQDIDTDSYTDDYVGTHDDTQQETANGQLSKKSYKVETRKEDHVTHEHDTAAYHETPMHKFIVDDKEVENESLGQYTVTEDKQTEYKGKDGVTEDIQENKRKFLNTDREEHTDNLAVKAMSKDHPESPLLVTLSTRIIDKDHYSLKESASRNKQTKLQNGGTRTVQEKEVRVKTYNMDATPNLGNK